MKKIFLKIENLASNGSGVGRREGKVYFVPWGVPGDHLSVEVKKNNKNFIDASLVEIIEKSPHRMAPPCPYYFKCGGCQLQHIGYESQLRFKKEIIRNALKRIGRLNENCVEDVVPAKNVWHYRTKIELHRNGNNRLGFYKLQSHEVVEIDRCLIADERLNKKMALLKNSPGSPSSIHLSLDGSLGFSQANQGQNEILIRSVVELIDPKLNENIFDLYCGGGNFTIPLSNKARHLVGVERSQEGYNQAVGVAQKKDIHNITWIHASVASALITLQGTPCDKMIVNPPRFGMAQEIKGIVSFRPVRIVYVSCNPATFARDASHLAEGGYSLEKCLPVDMFPQTVHCELVGLFRLSPR